MWDTFHGSLASHKCKCSCLTPDTVCVASATKDIDALLKNKWSTVSIYMVISSLIVYFLQNSMKFLFKKNLFDGVGLLVSSPPKKIVRIGQRTRKLRTFYDIGLLFHVQLSTTTGPLGTNVRVNHKYLSFCPYEANSQ